MDRASQSQRKHKNPSFFRVLIQDFSTLLPIPQAFIKFFGKEVPKKAILETYYGKSEEVELEKYENRFCFCKGWSKFVEDNKLENGDFLVFKYVSDCSKFKVMIYGKTCCEKKYYYSTYSESGKNEKERNNNNNVGDGQKRKREEQKEKDNNNVNEDGTVKSAKRFETDSDSDFHFGDEDSEDELINIDSDSTHPIAEDEEENGNSKQPSREEKENGDAKRLHSDNQIEFESECPFFQVKLKSSSINHYLNIPLNFSRKYIRESQSQEIKLEMPNKKVCELGLLVLWVGGGKQKEMVGARVNQGWKNLVSEYHLQLGDFCIFELIQLTHILVFRLHVLRRDAQTNKFNRIL